MMMTRNNMLAAAMLVAVTGMASCKPADVSYRTETVVENVSDTTGDPNVNYHEETRDGSTERRVKVRSFDAVTVKGVADVVYVQAAECALVLRGSREYINEYHVSQHGSQLVLSCDRSNLKQMVRKNDVKAYVYAPTLKQVNLSGAGDLNMQGKVNLPNALSVSLSGAGDIGFDDLQAQALDISVSGAGDVTLGKVSVRDDVRMSVSGAGDIKGTVKARNVLAGLSGAGDVTLTVQCDTLDCEASGAGDMKFKGECRVLRASKSGWSGLNTKQLKVKGK